MLLTQPCQRWRDRAHSWRTPAGGVIDPARYAVARITDAEARPFVTRHHYSGTYPAARLAYGLFDLADPGPALAGAAVLSVPPSAAVLTTVLPGLAPYDEALELGRFVLLDEVPANGETWMLAEVRRLAAAAGLRGLVSFSDPVRRTTADGRTVMPGHVGLIYQASNAVYTGQSTARTLTVLPDGTVFSDRAAQKIRRQDQGHGYAERQLTVHGARPLRAGESPARWLAEALDTIGARRVRHPGNHRYVFRLGTTRAQRAAVRITAAPRPYPKQWLGQTELDLTAA